MIDLDKTREEMLSDVVFPGLAPAVRLSDPSDSRFSSADHAHLLMRAHSRDDIMPVLGPALRARYHDVPDDRLRRDLVYPLKKALGNAHKRGNCGNPELWITVDAVVTTRGALIVVSDEGDGFDVEAKCRQLRAGKRYFDHAGSGLMGFEESASLVSYADGGRTVLIRFLCFEDPTEVAESDSLETSGLAGDGNVMRAMLAELPMFRRPGMQITSCTAYVPEHKRGERCEIGYEVEHRDAVSGRTRTTLLRGRTLPAQEAAADFAATSHLYREVFDDSSVVRVAQPLANLQEPPVALYESVGGDDLRSHLKKSSKKKAVRATANAIGSGLRLIHLSSLPANEETTVEQELVTLQRPRARIAGRLEELEPEAAHTAQRVWSLIDDRAKNLVACERAPIHGAFGFNCIVYDHEAAVFYFKHFEHSRVSHPGFDVGQFVADLVRLYLLRKKVDVELHEEARGAFVESYAGGADLTWMRDLDWFVAVALAARLERMVERPPKKWRSKVGSLLAQCEELLT